MFTCQYWTWSSEVLHSLYFIVLFPAEHPHSKKLHTFSFLTMLAVSTQVVETNPNSAPEVVYIIHWKMFWLQTVVSCTWCKRYLFLLKYCLETWFTFMYVWQFMVCYLGVVIALPWLVDRITSPIASGFNGAVQLYLISFQLISCSYLTMS